MQFIEKNILNNIIILSKKGGFFFYKFKIFNKIKKIN